MASEQSESIASWVFRGVLWRCNLVKEGSWEIRVFHDLQTHLNCIRIFTGRRDRISAMSSSKRTNIGAPLFGWRDLGGERGRSYEERSYVIVETFVYFWVREKVNYRTIWEIMIREYQAINTNLLTPLCIQFSSSFNLLLFAIIPSTNQILFYYFIYLHKYLNKLTI